MWKHKEDHSEPIITAKQHVASSHREGGGGSLPPKAVVFCIGSAIDYLKRNYSTEVILEKLPKFIGSSECLLIKEQADICFIHGGYGAPAIADTVETVIALGVKDIILIGMCGGFSPKVKVGDVIIPDKILSEEGTSLHYYEQIEFVSQSEAAAAKGINYFSQFYNTYSYNTVTTDAVYRQTFYKENYWREKGCVGVDMEASALLSVSDYYGIRSNVILLVSDKHPMTAEGKGWEWGSADFHQIKERFVDHAIKYAMLHEKD